MVDQAPLGRRLLRSEGVGSGIPLRPSVSVLIPTHGDTHLLAKSLPVFLRPSDDNVEVLVMNNDPTQDVRGAIGETVNDPRLKLLEMGFEAGFARAINRGIRESRGEFVMFCNADLFPSPTYLDEVIGFFADHPTAGAATGKLLRFDIAANRPTDVIDTAGLILARNRRVIARGEGERDVGQFEQAEEVFGIDGAGLVARRSSLESIEAEGEYLDESFVMHKEDVDLSWRLRLAGWECWYVPSAVAFHGRTTRGLGQKRYLTALRTFHENEKQKTEAVRLHAMKNQWLMLIKNEDRYNLMRDLPFILAREGMVVSHNLLFSPRTLRAIPHVLTLVRKTLTKRRIIKGQQNVEPRTFRRWIQSGSGDAAGRS
jgi:GT2 family glycosyltransferase